MKKGKYITPNRRQRGFTIIEMMVTIAIVAVLASIAVPSMRTYVLNSRLNSASQDLLRTLQTARTEATKRQRNVIVCASDDPQAAIPVCGTATPAGWIVFDDINGDGDNSSVAELLEVHTVDASKVFLRGNGAVSYLASGFANPGSATAIVICDSRGNVDSNGGTTGATSVARGVDITGTGRARVTKNLTEISGLLTDIGAGTTCP